MIYQCLEQERQDPHTVTYITESKQTIDVAVIITRK